MSSAEDEKENPILSQAMRWSWKWKGYSINPARLAMRVWKTTSDVQREVAKALVRETFSAVYRFADAGCALVLEVLHNAGYYNARKRRIRPQSALADFVVVRAQGGRAQGGGGAVTDEDEEGKGKGKKRKGGKGRMLKRFYNLISLPFPVGNNHHVVRDEDEIAAVELSQYEVLDVANQVGIYGMSISNAFSSRQTGYFEDLQLILLKIIDDIYDASLKFGQQMFMRMNALLMTMWNTKNKLGSENNIRQNVAVFSDSVNSVKEIFKVQRRPSKSEHRRTFSDAFSLHERPQRVNYSIGIIEWIIKATAKITGVAYDHINQLLFGGLDDRSFHEFVLSVGYPYEQHEVVTEDGYILPLDRIPRKGSDCHRVVYFQHGVLDTAYAWISGSTGELATNCAFATFNKGYDIFLGNFRGNRNMLHTNSSISSKDYWDFSVNEHGIYDMSAIVDNIRKIKIKEGVPEDKLEITLIAHSLGGASSMVYLVWKRKMNLPHYIKKAILLSPAGYHHKIPRFCKITGPIIEMTLAKMIYGVRLPSSALVALTAKIMQDLRKMPAARDLISFFMAQVVGGNLKESAFTRVGNLTFNMLHSGTSKKMFLHFWHMYKVGKFELYDYENEFQNWMHYGSSKPLNILDNYHLLDIPIHFIAGDDDTLIPPEDVIVQHEALKRHHPELSRFVCFEGFSHLHFTYSQNDNVIGYISEQLD